MLVNYLDATPLAPEYETLVWESMNPRSKRIDWTRLHRGLTETAEWTEDAATHLVHLARSYGAFVLRNALAIAVAADIEDGEMGF
jgi:hypothetical protein